VTAQPVSGSAVLYAFDEGFLDDELSQLARPGSRSEEAQPVAS
jgi:hypothetical protein